MSNEPKWTETNGVIYYNHEGRKEAYTALDKSDQAQGICDTLNRLESEVERLNGELKAAIITMEKWVDIEAEYKSEVERLKAELSRCQSERLSAEEIFEMACWANENDYEAVGEGEDTVEEWIQLIATWRKSKEGDNNG